MEGKEKEPNGEQNTNRETERCGGKMGQSDHALALDFMNFDFVLVCSLSHFVLLSYTGPGTPTKQPAKGYGNEGRLSLPLVSFSSHIMVATASSPRLICLLSQLAKGISPIASFLLSDKHHKG
jgi:hypothetical protein